MSGLVEHGDNTDEERTAIKSNRETKAARSRRVRKSYEAVLSTQEGRAVIWDLIAGAGIMKSPLAFKADGDIAVNITLANVGRQDYGRKMFMEIGEDYPAMLSLMQKENL